MFCLEDSVHKYRSLFLLLQNKGHVEVRAGVLYLEVPANLVEVNELLLQHLGEAQCSNGTWRADGVTALDLLGIMVESDELNDQVAGSALERLYFEHCQAMPPASGGQKTPILVRRLEPTATIPQKARPSDSGYDLTLIAERKRFGQVVLYGTGLVVEPPAGYYFDIVARSSIIKTGHMLANNLGVIDRAYRGELMVPVVKIDPLAPDLELPNRLAQLIPRPIAHFPLTIVDELTHTSRGEGGFGSTKGT